MGIGGCGGLKKKCFLQAHVFNTCCVAGSIVLGGLWNLQEGSFTGGRAVLGDRLWGGQSLVSRPAYTPWFLCADQDMISRVLSHATLSPTWWTQAPWNCRPKSSFSLELLLGMVFIVAAEKGTNEKPGPGKQSFCSEEPDWCSCEECDVLLTRDCLCFWWRTWTWT